MIKLYHRLYKTTEIKADVIKQLDLSVTGGSEREKRTKRPLDLFYVPGIKNAVRGTCYSYTCLIKRHQMFAFKR